MADQYIQAHRADWKSATEENTWRARLRDHVFPVIGSLPVGEIDLALVLKVLEPKWSTLASMGKIRGYRRKYPRLRHRERTSGPAIIRRSGPAI